MSEMMGEEELEDFRKSSTVYIDMCYVDEEILSVINQAKAAIQLEAENKKLVEEKTNGCENNVKIWKSLSIHTERLGITVSK